MHYKKLAQLYEELSSTTKRLEKIKILSKFLEYVSEEDKDVIYLLLGRIYPSYDERKIGISNQLTVKAISKATGSSEKEVVKAWKKIGDLGEVSEELTKKRKQSTLDSKIITTKKVLENLRKLPELEGKGTVDKKLSLVTELLTSSSPIESKYLVRTLIGDLRIGVQESTIRESIASAFFEESKEVSEKIQKAMDKSNDLGIIFEIAKKKKINEFDKIHLEIGKPVKAMLAQKALTIEDGFKALGKPCAVEYKYDGFRLIIHKDGDEVKLFTRRLENVTSQFPEVINYIKEYVKGNSVILDSEAVGFDKKTKKYTPFQAISQRIKRKYNVDKLKDELPIEINVFDILYYNKKSLLDEPFEKRSELIRKIIKNHPYKIVCAKQIITSDEKKAKEFYKKALKDNQEGIMMKSLQAVYQPGSRVGHMLKVKPEIKDLDLVITGAECGAGKRSKWFSSFILSCRNKHGEYFEIGKVGTGIKEKSQEISEESEEDDKWVTFEQLTKLLKPLIIKEEERTIKVHPKIIVQVTYQEIQKSPNYNSGFALRFPRVVSLRHDKHLSEITHLEEIEKDFEEQKRNYMYG